MNTMNTLKDGVAICKLRLVKQSPTILMAAGIAGVVVSTVMACKATPKAEKIIAENKETLETIKMVRASEDYKEDYEDRDYRKDITTTYLKMSGQLIKNYAPSVLLGGLSIFCIVNSHNILRKRNAALAAAYGIVSKDLSNYRERVRDELGDDLENKIYNTITKEEVIDQETGETVEVEKAHTSGLNEYARIFYDTNPNWTKSPEDNKMFLLQQERYFNDILRLKKIVFLNDVYKALGFEPSKAGQIVGWFYDPNNPDCSNEIDFGLFDIQHPSDNRDFINGDERSVIINPNVDGAVWEYLK